jgi:hypothetical protein
MPDIMTVTDNRTLSASALPLVRGCASAGRSAKESCDCGSVY